MRKSLMMAALLLCICYTAVFADEASTNVVIKATKGMFTAQQQRPPAPPQTQGRPILWVI